MKEKANQKDIELTPATQDDAQLIHNIKYKAFLPLYEKYQDDETTPVKDTLEKTFSLINQKNSDYHIINYKQVPVGAVRIVSDKPNVYRISPLFILPEYQNIGIASTALELVFEKYTGAVVWRLTTILQESGNCHLYEKLGFTRTSYENIINDKMTLIGYEKSNVTVRRFIKEDADEVANLIRRNLVEVNIKDYGKEAIDELVKTHDANWVLYVASYAHMYVFCHGEKIVATGSISSYWGSPTESILLTIFVLPEYHGMGIGRKIIATLEEDELFKRASRIEIPASITGVEFYRKFGYDFKNGKKELDEESLYRLEKFRTPMTIRNMTANDYDKVYNLWINTPGMGLNSVDDSKEGIEKYLKRNPTTCFVAEENDNIVGVILSGHDGRRGYIHHTAVSSDFRNQGIGRRLVEHAIEALKSEGIIKVALVVFAKNELGNGFWEKVGFEVREDLYYRNKSIVEAERIDT